MGIIHHLHHPQDVFFVDDNSRQAEHAPGRIVGMNGHINVILLTYRHNSLQKILQVIEELFLVDIFVQFKEFFDFCHSFRLPSCKKITAALSIHGGEHVLRMDSIDGILIIRHDRRTIRTFSRQLRSHPIKDRHKIVANQMNIFFSQVFQCLNIVKQKIDIKLCIIHLQNLKILKI